MRLHLIRRDASAMRDALASLFAVLVSLAIMAFFILLAGAGPLTGFVVVFKAVFEVGRAGWWGRG